MRLINQLKEMSEKIKNVILSRDPSYFYYKDGSTIFVEERALSYLLLEDVLFPNSFPYAYNEGDKLHPATITLFVNCSDTFAWGCTDGENITLDEIEDLYKMWRASPIYGPTKWVCIKRNEKPMKPLEESMKKAGIWDPKMESLKPNYYWSRIEENKNTGS
jgi:hypothetical protein